MVKKLEVNRISISDLQRKYPNLFSTSNNDVFSILSIDVEGGSEEVIDSIDFSFSKPDIILIELLKPVFGKGLEISEFSKLSSDSCYLRLVNEGYVYVGGNTMTQYFVLKSHLVMQDSSF